MTLTFYGDFMSFLLFNLGSFRASSHLLKTHSQGWMKNIAVWTQMCWPWPELGDWKDDLHCNLFIQDLQVSNDHKLLTHMIPAYSTWFGSGVLEFSTVASQQECSVFDSQAWGLFLLPVSVWVLCRLPGLHSQSTDIHVVDWKHLIAPRHECEWEVVWLCVKSVLDWPFPYGWMDGWMRYSTCYLLGHRCSTCCHRAVFSGFMSGICPPVSWHDLAASKGCTHSI